MRKALPNGHYRAENAALAGSEILNTNLEGAKFHDANLRAADFSDVDLNGATIRNACLIDVTIADANYTGRRIEGILVADLLRVFRERKGPDPAFNQTCHPQPWRTRMPWSNSRHAAACRSCRA
jgi:uncharacterized protein YjbI with pentapeptide repeats